MSTREPVSRPDAARRRFLITQTAVLLAFAIVMIATASLLRQIETPFQRWLLALGPAALLILWAWEFFRMIRAEDEMMQAAHLRAVAISAGLVLFTASLWGIPERMLDAPQIPAFLLLPAFACVYALAMPLVRPR